MTSPDSGLQPWIDLWLAAAVLFPLLAFPSRRLLWLFVGAVGTPVLSWALLMMAAQITDEPPHLGRLHRWMLIAALAEVLLWLLWQRLRGWRRPPITDPGTTAIDLAAAALLFAWLRHLFDPFVTAVLPGARWTTMVSLPAWALSLLIPLALVMVVAALWRRWRGARYAGLALAFAMGAIALVLVVMQARYGLIVAGHSGVSFAGLFRAGELMLIGLGCPAVAVMALLSAPARQALEVTR